MEDYDVGDTLGGGSFAIVKKAKEKKTGEDVAFKILKMKYSKWEDCLELRECKSLKMLHEEHLSYQKGIENIIKLKQIIHEKNGTLNLVFEYMEKNLFELMKEKAPKKLTENQIQTITHQTLLGLRFMHKYGYFHRDMKPENLLISGDILKIADFGLAREIRSVPPYTEYVSTRYYRAPECILKSTNYNSPVDIWALGCIMAEMYQHPQPLFFGNTEKEVLFRVCSILGTPTHTSWYEGMQQANKINLKFPNCPGTPLEQIIPQASTEAIDLMNQMLQWDPNKRATANSLLQHPFFTRYPMNNRITTDHMQENQSFGRAKLYSNKPMKPQPQAIVKSTIPTVIHIEDKECDYNQMLNDTDSFEKFITKLKSDEGNNNQQSNKDKGNKVKDNPKNIAEENVKRMKKKANNKSMDSNTLNSYSIDKNNNMNVSNSNSNSNNFSNTMSNPSNISINNTIKNTNHLLGSYDKQSVISSSIDFPIDMNLNPLRSSQIRNSPIKMNLSPMKMNVSPLKERKNFLDFDNNDFLIEKEEKGARQRSAIYYPDKSSIELNRYPDPYIPENPLKGNGIYNRDYFILTNSPPCRQTQGQINSDFASRRNKINNYESKFVVLNDSGDKNEILQKYSNEFIDKPNRRTNIDIPISQNSNRNMNNNNNNNHSNSPSNNSNGILFGIDSRRGRIVNNSTNNNNAFW